MIKHSTPVKALGKEELKGLVIKDFPRIDLHLPKKK